MGMRTSEVSSVDSGRTAVCNMILDHRGGLNTGVADMDIIHALDKHSVSVHLAMPCLCFNCTCLQILETLQKHQPSIVCVDANLSPETIQAVCMYCYKQEITRESFVVDICA